MKVDKKEKENLDLNIKQKIKKLEWKIKFTKILEENEENKLKILNIKKEKLTLLLKDTYKNIKDFRFGDNGKKITTLEEEIKATINVKEIVRNQIQEDLKNIQTLQNKIKLLNTKTK